MVRSYVTQTKDVFLRSVELEALRAVHGRPALRAQLCGLHLDIVRAQVVASSLSVKSPNLLARPHRLNVLLSHPFAQAL